MKKIGLFYGEGSSKTAVIAKEIKAAFGDATDIGMMSITEVWDKEFELYGDIIAGVSTWFDGEVPSCWDEMIPKIKTLNLKGRKVAIFGLGDQVRYPDNFVDGMGTLAKVFEDAGATLIGLTSTEGYQFNKSTAVRNGQFLGLAIDADSQADKTEARIKNWVVQLKKELAKK